MILSLNSLAVFGFVTQATVLAVLLYGFGRALERAQSSVHVRRQVWLSITVVILAWYGVVSGLAIHDAFRASPTARSPMLPIFILAPVIFALWLILRSEAMTKAVDATPLSWLVGLQVYRAIGGVFLVLWGTGQLPWQFAVPAGVGDVLVGLTAIPIAMAAATDSAVGRKAAYQWNLLGIIDLAVAVGI